MAIDRLLDDRRRIADICRHLHLGAQFFEHKRGTLVPGRVLKLEGEHGRVPPGMLHKTIDL